jgi:hypothetical protein
MRPSGLELLIGIMRDELWDPYSLWVEEASYVSGQIIYVAGGPR